MDPAGHAGRSIGDAAPHRGGHGFHPVEGGAARGAELARSILRGYPLAFVLALTLVFLAAVGIVRKVQSLARRWSDAHVPIVVREGGYALMVADLEEALDEAGLAVDRGEAPAVMAVPGRLLASIAGPGVRALVPDRLAQLTGRGLEIDLYPSDIAIAGQPSLVTRARAAMASRLASTAAFLTTSAESQAIEERLERLAREGQPGPAADAELIAVDRLLATIEVPYEEWEVLYRIRLQVERDLLSGIKPGHDFRAQRTRRLAAIARRNGTPRRSRSCWPRRRSGWCCSTWFLPCANDSSADARRSRQCRRWRCWLVAFDRLAFDVAPQGKPELCPAAGSRFGPDAPTHGVDEPAAHEQANPGA